MPEGAANIGESAANSGYQVEEVDSWVWSDEGNSDSGLLARRQKSEYHHWEGDDIVGRRVFGPLNRRGNGAVSLSLSFTYRGSSNKSRKRATFLLQAMHVL